MPLKAKAFCPGHITAFFEICDDPDPLRKGSRGAGLCISRGVISSVEAFDSEKFSVEVQVRGYPAKGEVTKLAAEKLVDGLNYRIIVASEVQLPISQGFGMSGAGALSAVLALNEALALGKTRNEIVSVAHAAEVESATGLGDVYPQSLGGMDIRERPGAPPFGIVKMVPMEEKVVLCAMDPPMETKDVLRNEYLAGRISSIGRRCADRFLRNPTRENLFRQANLFVRETTLASAQIREAIALCRPHGHAAMSMLGNSVFAMGHVDELANVLSGCGQVFVCDVDNHGAKLL